MVVLADMDCFKDNRFMEKENRIFESRRYLRAETGGAFTLRNKGCKGP